MAKSNSTESVSDKPADSAPVVIDVEAHSAELLAESAGIEAEVAAKAKAAEAEAAAAAEASTKARPRYSVGPGKSVTTLRGLLHEGEEIQTEWLAGDDLAVKLRTMVELLNSKAVVINPSSSA